MAKPALGRGLSALLGGSSTSSRPTPPAAPTPPPSSNPATPNAPTTSGVIKVAISQIHPCAFQPRKDFPPAALEELADSIRAQGIIQPLIVRKSPQGYELIAGERRWRAAQLAELKEVPIVLREADDKTLLELALIENLQRENLNPIEESKGFAELMERFGLTQEEAAVKVGRSRASVANALRLLKLPTTIQDQLREGTLSVGHAKVILSLSDPTLQIKAAQQAAAKQLSVRQTEQLVASLQSSTTHSPASSSSNAAPTESKKDANLLAIETKLQEKLGTKIHLKYLKGKGSLEIKFFSDDDLQRVLDILGIQLD